MREGCWQSVWRDLKSWDPCGSAKHTHQSKFPSQTGFCFHFGILHHLYSLPAVLFCVSTNETMQIITLLIINSWSGGGGFIWCGYCGYNLLLNCQRIFISLVNIISVCLYVYVCSIWGILVYLCRFYLPVSSKRKAVKKQSPAKINPSPPSTFLLFFHFSCAVSFSSAVIFWILLFLTFFHGDEIVLH